MPPSNAEACPGIPFILDFMVWVDEDDRPGLFLNEQVPLRNELRWVESEFSTLTITPHELVQLLKKYHIPIVSCGKTIS